MPAKSPRAVFLEAALGYPAQFTQCRATPRRVHHVQIFMDRSGKEPHRLGDFSVKCGPKGGSPCALDLKRVERDLPANFRNELKAHLEGIPEVVKGIDAKDQNPLAQRIGKDFRSRHLDIVKKVFEDDLKSLPGQRAAVSAPVRHRSSVCRGTARSAVASASVRGDKDAVDEEPKMIDEMDHFSQLAHVIPEDTTSRIITLIFYHKPNHQPQTVTVFLRYPGHFCLADFRVARSLQIATATGQPGAIKFQRYSVYSGSFKPASETLTPLNAEHVGDVIIYKAALLPEPSCPDIKKWKDRADSSAAAQKVVKGKTRELTEVKSEADVLDLESESDLEERKDRPESSASAQKSVKGKGKARDLAAVKIEDDVIDLGSDSDSDIEFVETGCLKRVRSDAGPSSSAKRARRDSL